MASYYIAMNRSTGKSAQENFEIFRDGLCASKLFHKVMGDVDSYLDPKKMPGRLKWSEDSHKRLYENDWVVDILPGNGEYDLGYDYHECGACKLCRNRRRWASVQVSRTAISSPSVSMRQRYSSGVSP